MCVMFTCGNTMDTLASERNSWNKKLITIEVVSITILWFSIYTVEDETYGEPGEDRIHLFCNAKDFEVLLLTNYKYRTAEFRVRKIAKTDHDCLRFNNAQSEQKLFLREVRMKIQVRFFSIKFEIIVFSRFSCIKFRILLIFFYSLILFHFLLVWGFWRFPFSFIFLSFLPILVVDMTIFYIRLQGLFSGDWRFWVASN